MKSFKIQRTEKQVVIVVVPDEWTTDKVWEIVNDMCSPGLWLSDTPYDPPIMYLFGDDGESGGQVIPEIHPAEYAEYQKAAQWL
jgi:hypothetical protein